jgi:hypothetical protein
MICAEFFCERFYVFASPQGNGFKSHFASVLHTEMSEAANSLNRDKRRRDALRSGAGR